VPLTGTYFTRTNTSIAVCIECHRNSGTILGCEQLLLTQLETHITLSASRELTYTFLSGERLLSFSSELIVFPPPVYTLHITMYQTIFLSEI
jgi:hypothetical protein